MNEGLITKIKQLKKNFVLIFTFIEIVSIVILSYRIHQKLNANVLGYAIGEPPPSTFNFEGKENYILYADLLLEDYVKYEPKREVEFFGLKLNQDGLNSEKNYDLEKPKGVFRIIAIGDSHTFGYGVSTEKNYPSQLEQTLNRNYCKSLLNCFEVINLGIPGFDPLFTTYRYGIKGEKYNPDLIVWYLKTDDFNEIWPLMQKYTKTCIDNGYNTENSPSDPYSVVEKNEDYCWLWSLSSLWKYYGKEQVENFNFNIIDTFASKLNNKKILFLTYKGEDKQYISHLLQLKELYDTVYIDNELEYNDISRLPDSHPDENGYKIIANNLSKYIYNKIINDPI
jgi:hypothetical protein